MAAARLTAAGRRLRTTGRAATTNGRIWFLTIGAPGTASAVSAWLAPLSALAAGSRFVAAGPSCCANACTLASVAVVWLSVPGRSATARLTFAVLGRERAEHLLARVDQLDDLRLLGRERDVQALERVDQLAQIGAALGDRLVEPREVAVGRLEPLHHLRELIAAVLLEPLAGAVDEQVEVLAAVGVERGEDLVEVDDRHRVRDRDRVARLRRRARSRSRG